MDSRANGKPQALRERPWLYALVGMPGAGKSTLARRWSDHLGGIVVHEDDFLIEPDRRTGPTLHEKYDLDAFGQAVADLLGGQPTTYVPFNLQSRCRLGWRRLEPKPFVVVEGVTALYCPLVQYTASLRVFLDAAPSIRHERQVVRLDEEGLYRDLPRAEVLARIFGKDAHEADVIRAQRALCDWEIDTTDGLISPVLLGTDRCATLSQVFYLAPICSFPPTAHPGGDTLSSRERTG